MRSYREKKTWNITLFWWLSLKLMLLLANVGFSLNYFKRSALCDDQHTQCQRSSSFITKWAARISREWFGLESPNFTLTSIMTYRTTYYCKSSGKLSRKKNIKMKMLPLMASGQVSPEQFKWRSWNFMRLLGELASQTSQLRKIATHFIRGALRSYAFYWQPDFFIWNRPS